MRGTPGDVNINCWRLLIHEPAAGPWNMAVDEALLESVHRSGYGGTLRFFRWAAPTISLGCLQPFERALDAEFCRRHGLAVVRRPTGGRAVLHHQEITYSVTATREAFPGGGSVMETYRLISTGLCRGLNLAGIPAEVSRPSVPLRGRRPQSTPPIPGPRHTEPCFSSVSRYELTCGGKKLLGSAQRRLSDRFLQHGSLPVIPHWNLLLGATGSNEDPTATGKAYISLREAAGIDEPDIDGLIRLLARGFSEELGLTLIEAPLDPLEAASARRLEEMKYATPEWTRSR